MQYWYIYIYIIKCIIAVMYMFITVMIIIQQKYHYIIIAHIHFCTTQFLLGCHCYSQISTLKLYNMVKKNLAVMQRLKGGNTLGTNSKNWHSNTIIDRPMCIGVKER